MSCTAPVFFFTDPATPEIYTLSLHDALPISTGVRGNHDAAALGGPEIELFNIDARRAAEWTRASILNRDRKSTRLNSSHMSISYAVFCLKKKTLRNPAVANMKKSLALHEPEL